MGQHREPRNKLIHIQHLTFDKGVKNIQCGKDSLLNKWCWENQIIRQNNEIGPPFTPLTQMNLK